MNNQITVMDTIEPIIHFFKPMEYNKLALSLSVAITDNKRILINEALIIPNGFIGLYKKDLIDLKF